MDCVCPTSYLVAAAAVLTASLLLVVVRSRRRRSSLRAAMDRFRFRPGDTVVLHMPGRTSTSPNLSPFPIKLETYLRAMDIK